MIPTFRTLVVSDIHALAARHDSEENIQHALAELLHLREREQQRGVLTLRWKRCGEHDFPVPSRAHVDDAGIDLPVIVTEADTNCYLRTHEPAVRVFDGHHVLGAHVFGAGWAVAIPPGWCGLIVVRSSVGKAGWDLESSGLIDSGYHGEILLPLVYRGDTFNPRRIVRHGDRMAQMLLLPVPRVESEEVASLPATARGEGGFGSTGSGSAER